MGHALWGRVEDSDAGFLRGEGELPECKPGGDVVKNRLDVAQLGLPPGGRAARDRRVDSRVVGKLGGRGVGGDGDCEVIDVDCEEKRAENGALGDSVGHGPEGASVSFVLAGHGSACEVVREPETCGAGDLGLVEDFPDEALGPDRVKRLADVKRDE